jgi:hypothetical protein
VLRPIDHSLLFLSLVCLLQQVLHPSDFSAPFAIVHLLKLISLQPFMGHSPTI